MGRIIGVRNDRTVYRDGDEKGKEYFSAAGKTAVFGEAARLAAVETMGLDVPALIGAVIQNGRWTLMTEYIPGTSLDRELSRLSQETADGALFHQFVLLHRKIHQATLTPEAWAVLPLMTTELGRRLTEVGMKTRFDRLAAEGVIALCHGDFAPENVILRPDGTLCVIDWENAMLGDPHGDGALTYLKLRLSGAEALAEEYLKLYDDERVKLWIPVMAAALLSTVGRDSRAVLLPLTKL